MAAARARMARGEPDPQADFFRRQAEQKEIESREEARLLHGLPKRVRVDNPVDLGEYMEKDFATQLPWEKGSPDSRWKTFQLIMRAPGNEQSLSAYRAASDDERQSFYDKTMADFSEHPAYAHLFRVLVEPAREEVTPRGFGVTGPLSPKRESIPAKYRPLLPPDREKMIADIPELGKSENDPKFMAYFTKALHDNRDFTEKVARDTAKNIPQEGIAGAVFEMAGGFLQTAAGPLFEKTAMTAANNLAVKMGEHDDYSDDQIKERAKKAADYVLGSWAMSAALQGTEAKTLVDKVSRFTGGVGAFVFDPLTKLAMSPGNWVFNKALIKAAQAGKGTALGTSVAERQTAQILKTAKTAREKLKALPGAAAHGAAHGAAVGVTYGLATAPVELFPKEGETFVSHLKHAGMEASVFALFGGTIRSSVEALRLGSPLFYKTRVLKDMTMKDIADIEAKVREGKPLGELEGDFLEKVAQELKVITDAGGKLNLETMRIDYTVQTPRGPVTLIPGLTGLKRQARVDLRQGEVKEAPRTERPVEEVPPQEKPMPPEEPPAPPEKPPPLPEEPPPLPQPKQPPATRKGITREASKAADANLSLNQRGQAIFEMRQSSARGEAAGREGSELTDEEQALVESVEQEMSEAGMEFHPSYEVGKEFKEGTTAKFKSVVPTEKTESLRLHDGEHAVITRVHKPGITKDGVLMGGKDLPDVEVTNFEAKVEEPPAAPEVKQPPAKVEKPAWRTVTSEKAKAKGFEDRRTSILVEDASTGNTVTAELRLFGKEGEPPSVEMKYEGEEHWFKPTIPKKTLEKDEAGNVTKTRDYTADDDWSEVFEIKEWRSAEAPALPEVAEAPTDILPSDKELLEAEYLSGPLQQYGIVHEGGGTSIVKGKERIAKHISRSAKNDELTVHYTPSDLPKAEPQETDSVSMAEWREGRPEAEAGRPVPKGPTGVEGMPSRPVELDEKYFDAVERGDMEAAQALVDEAAKLAGHTVKAGHATPFEFTEFDRSQISDADPDTNIRGFFFSTEPDVHSAAVTGSVDRSGNVRLPKTKIANAYLKLGKTIKRGEAQRIVNKQIQQGYIKKYFDKEGNPLVEDVPPIPDDLTFPKGYDTVLYEEGLKWTPEKQKEFDQKGEITEGGRTFKYDDVHDGVDEYETEIDALGRIQGEQHITGTENLKQAYGLHSESIYLVKDPNQIKSADPVTYDAQGKPIPLSQRFGATDTGVEGPFEPGMAVEKLLEPRRIEAEPKTPNEDPLTGRPLNYHDVRRYLSARLDVPIRLGVNRRNVLGYYRTGAESIRVKFLKDISTIGHETGHYLHWILFSDVDNVIAKIAAGDRKPGSFRASDYRKFDEYHNELVKLGAPTSKKHYTAQEKRLEGVAEFVRIWLTDDAGSTNAVAPKFHEYFEKTIEEKYPEVWDILKTAHDMIERIRKQTDEEIIKSMIISGGKDPEPPMKLMDRIREGWHKMLTKMFDDVHPIHKLFDDLVKTGMDPKEANLVTSKMVNYVAGAQSISEATINGPMRNLAGDPVGPGYAEVLRGVSDFEEYDMWLVAGRATEYHKKDMLSGIPPDVAARIDAKYRKLFAKDWPKLQKLTGQSLELVRDIVGDEGIRAMKKDWKRWVPFWRNVETVMGRTTPAATGGFVNVGNAIHYTKGSDAEILSPLETILRNLYYLRDLGMRNEVAKLFTEALITAHRGGALGGDPIVAKVTPIDVSAKEAAEMMVNTGILDLLTQKGKNLPEGMEYGEAVEFLTDYYEKHPAELKIWRAQHSGNDPKKGIYSYWDNGKQLFFHLPDKDIYRSLMLMDRETARKFGEVLKWFGVPQATKLVKGTAVMWNHLFWMPNLVKQEWQALTWSKHGFKPFDGLRQIFHAFKKDDKYQEFMGRGGGLSGFYGSGRDSLKETLRDLLEKRDPAAWRLAKKLINPIRIAEGLTKIGQVTENMTRMAEFERAMEKTGDPLTASLAAQEIGLPFAQGGVVSKVANIGSAFFNAGMLDFRKFVGEHWNRPGHALWSNVKYFTLPSLLFWWMGKDDDAINKLPDWRKNFFINVNLGRLLGGEDSVWSIPYPFTTGMVYGALPARAFDYIHKDDPQAIESWFHDFLKIAPFALDIKTPGLEGVPIPTAFIPDIIQPTMENMSGPGGHSFWSGRPVVPEPLQKRSPSLQWTENTSEVAKWIGRKLNLSPMKIDHYIKGHFTGLGRTTTRAIDELVAVAATQPNAKPWEPVSERWWNPANRFVVPGMEPHRDLDRFYRGARAAEQVVGDFMLAPKALKLSPALREKNRAKYNWYNQERTDRPPGPNNKYRSRLYWILDERKALNDLSKTMRMIRVNRGLSAKEKHKRLKRQRIMADKRAVEALELLHPDDGGKGLPSL